MALPISPRKLLAVTDAGWTGSAVVSTVELERIRIVRASAEERADASAQGEKAKGRRTTVVERTEVVSVRLRHEATGARIVCLWAGSAPTCWRYVQPAGERPGLPTPMNFTQALELARRTTVEIADYEWKASE